MATFTDTIRFVVEASTGAAERGIKGLRSELSQAEGATGKLKAVGGQVGGFLKDNLALGVAGAGAAIAGFAAKAIGDFQELALSADKFAAASGLAVEDASRWIEVTGDIGVNTETISGAMDKLNKAAAKGDLAKFGIDADDANERLIQTLEKLGGITDETARAKLGAQLLGKSWTELAPLIAASGTLRDNLEAVSDAKVINQDEVDKAKRYRDTMDDLNGIVEDLTLQVGGGLVPVVSNLADALQRVSDVLAAMPDLPPGIDKILTSSGLQLAGNLISNVGKILPGGDTTSIGDIGREAGFQPQSNARVAPPGTPGVSGGTVNITNNYPPSTDGRQTDASLEEYYRKNGRG